MSSVQESFNRLVVVTVYGRDRTFDSAGNIVIKDIDLIGKQYPSRFEDGSPGFRIQFTVEKPSGPFLQANVAQIQMYNLGAISRNFLSDTRNAIELRAGYGNSANVIFRGTINFAKTHKEGPTYVTTINAADGLEALQGSNTNKSFQAGIDIKTIITTLASQLKPQGISQGQIEGIPAQSFNQGLVLSGNTAKLLKEVCEKNNLNFSIQEGKITILPYGSPNGIPAITISSDTGMIGIPEIRGAGYANPLINTGAPKPQEQLVKETSIISFKSLLNSQLTMHSQVLIVSKFINGLYTIVKLIHRGDSFGGEMVTECEAT